MYYLDLRALADMSSRLTSFAAEWSGCLQSFSESEQLCELKSFWDQFLCDVDFRTALAHDFFNVLGTLYPRLGSSDVISFLPDRLSHQWKLSGLPSALNSRLREILALEQTYRKFLKSLHPVHSGWSVWRDGQMSRLSHEDSSQRSDQITHIPFAIELTEGCSGACQFCGFSAPPLRRDSPHFADNKSLFLSLLNQLSDLCGPSAVSGALYWATDPFDHPDYERYAECFQSVFGLWPITTTALAERQVGRLRSLLQLRSAGPDRPWGMRCSLRSRSAYQTLCKQLTPLERSSLVLIPQYSGALSAMAVAGRAYQPSDQDVQESLGGTIACVTGFLVSLPRQSLALITPCLAEPNHPNGYRTLQQTEFSRESLRADLNHVLAQLPCPSIHLNTSLALTIDASQFKLYPCSSCPDLLERMARQPFTLQGLLETLPEHAEPQDVISFSLTMLQSGALSASGSR